MQNKEYLVNNVELRWTLSFAKESIADGDSIEQSIL